jgi:hypothetical protein
VDGDNVAVLDPQIVPHNAVYPGGAVIEVIISKDDQDGVLPLLALHKNCVATEELERLHGIVGEGDDGVVIVDGIGDAVSVVSCCTSSAEFAGGVGDGLHQGIGLLLLLQNGRCCLVVLWRIVSNRHLRRPGGDIYIFVLSAGWIPGKWLAAVRW